MDSEPIARLQDLADGKPHIVKLPKGKEIVLIREGSQVFALDNACPHEGGPLGEGKLEGCILSCPWHGWQFDIKTGASITCPGDDAEKIAVKVVGDQVFLA